MELHSSNQASSPVGFQATLNVAMELENKLKCEVDDGYAHLPQQQTHVCGTGDGRHGVNDDDCDEDEDDDGKRTVIKNLNGGSPLISKDDIKRDVLNSSDALESEIMEDDDDDSMGRSSPGSYADLSPSVDNSKEGTEDMDDEFDPHMRKFSHSIGRNRLQQQPDGSSQAFSVNGGRPGSSEGDYYDGGGGMNSDSAHMYNHIGRPGSASPTVENGGSDKFYPCHLCSFTAATKSHFNSHMNTHYNHKCNHCDYTSRTEGRLKRHMKDFHSDLPPEAYSSSRVLKGDRDGGHGDSNGNSQGKVKTYRCKQCNFTATVKAIFWDHTKSHIKAEKLLTCPKCPFVTEYKHHLEYHLRNHFGSKPFKCPKCNYSCVNKSMLNSHMKSHSNVYQYRCSDCTYATKYCHSLKLHLRKYTHKPAVVLNPDGTPNPIPVIDVYGTRRGPRQKKGSHNEEQKIFCNGNGNTNGSGAIPFSPIAVPVNGALSPATVIPFFYPGASGPITNGFHTGGMDGLLRSGSMDKSPNGAPPLPPPTHISNNSNHSSSNGTNGSSSIESEMIENEKVQHSKNTAIKCNLCPFVTDNRETFSKHMILHAAAENQDLCSLYGINSESLVLEPNQHQQQQHQHVNATTMAAMVAALGLSGAARNDIHRSVPANFEMLATNNNFRCSPNSAGNGIANNKVKSSGADEEMVSGNGGVGHMANPLEHLRMFSEQTSIQAYNASRDFAPQHYSSPNMVSYMLETSPTTGEKSSSASSSSYSPGANSQKASHKSKASKEGAISMKSKSPQLNETMNVTIGLSPLDLSSAKNGSSVARIGNGGCSPQVQIMSPQYHSPRFLSPVSANQPMAYDSLQVSTEGIACSQQQDLISPSSQTKHRRKGRAYKLDRICLKLQKDYGYTDSPSNELAADDSIGDADRPRSSEETLNDLEMDFKGAVEVKEEIEQQAESDCQQPIKEMETTGGKKSPVISPRASTKCGELKKSSPPLHAKPPVVDLIDGEDGENENVGKNGWKEAYECQYCDMAFRDCVMYTVHMGYHGFKDPFKCNMCGQQTKDKVAFFLHIARTAHL